VVKVNVRTGNISGIFRNSFTWTELSEKSLSLLKVSVNLIHPELAKALGRR